MAYHISRLHLISAENKLPIDDSFINEQLRQVNIIVEP
jgi:hypothetical protein